MAECYKMQSYCSECGYEDVEYEDINPTTPFHLPHWERKNKPKVHKPKFNSYYPLDPRKHPVSMLHEYCSMQNIQPMFEFYEIPQKIGIEYGCIATVENFIGEGRAFSKKTAKHQAAVDLLKKLSQPNYLGDYELGPRRFVSETGIVSVHYESTPKRRSCFKNRHRMTPPLRLQQAKRVKWQDSSDGETEDERHKGSLEELRPKSNEIELLSDSENDNENHDYLKKTSSIENKIKSESDEDHSEKEGRFKMSSKETPVKNQLDAKNPRENEDLIDEISEYLSERLRRTSIEKTNEVKTKQADYSSDEIEVVELNDVKPKKKKRAKRSNEMMLDGTQTLGRKSCLKEVNPIGYLQEACMFFNCIPASYNFYREGKERIRAVCTLFDNTTEAFGETQKEAKRMAAVLMIQQLGW